MSFVSGKMVGVKTDKKTPTQVPVGYKVPKDAKPQQVGNREYVAVQFKDVPMNAVCYQEYKPDSYLCYTKVKADEFPGDFIVWIFVNH